MTRHGNGARRTRKRLRAGATGPPAGPARGAALVAVIGMLTLLAAAAAVFARTSAVERAASRAGLDRTRAHLAADSGLATATALAGRTTGPVGVVHRAVDIGPDATASVTIEPANARIHLNGGALHGERAADPDDPANRPVRRLLDNLGAVLGLGDGLGRRIVEARPAGGWRATDALRAVLDPGEFAAVEPLVTVHAWTDPTVVRPDPDFTSPTGWTDYDPSLAADPGAPPRARYRNGRTSKPLRADVRPVRAVLQPRAPVDLHAAAPEVLAAVFLGLGARELQRRAGADGEEWHRTADAGPISLSQARAVADWIAAERTARPFDTRDGFRRRLLAGCAAAGQVVSRDPDLTWDADVRVGDLITAMADPSVLLNDLNPDAVVARPVDKLDLTGHTTELALRPTGLWILTSEGIVRGSGGRILARAAVRETIRTHVPVTVSTQEQFAACAADPDVRTGPENPDDPETAPAAWAGWTTLRPDARVRRPGRLFARADFAGDLLLRRSPAYGGDAVAPVGGFDAPDGAPVNVQVSRVRGERSVLAGTDLPGDGVRLWSGASRPLVWDANRAWCFNNLDDDADETEHHTHAGTDRERPRGGAGTLAFWFKPEWDSDDDRQLRALMAHAIRLADGPASDDGLPDVARLTLEVDGRGLLCEALLAARGTDGPVWEGVADYGAGVNGRPLCVGDDVDRWHTDWLISCRWEPPAERFRFLPGHWYHVALHWWGVATVHAHVGGRFLGRQPDRHDWWRGTEHVTADNERSTTTDMDGVLANTWAIGCNPFDDPDVCPFLEGTLDDLRIWDRCVTADEDLAVQRYADPSPEGWGTIRGAVILPRPGDVAAVRWTVRRPDRGADGRPLDADGRGPGTAPDVELWVAGAEAPDPGGSEPGGFHPRPDVLRDLVAGDRVQWQARFTDNGLAAAGRFDVAPVLDGITFVVRVPVERLGRADVAP